MERYTRNELRVLWYLKRKGPMTLAKHGGGGKYSLLGTLAYECNMTNGALRHTLTQLEARSLVLRTYAKGKAAHFAAQGHNPITKIELVDPHMELPPLPPNPPSVVIVKENEELYERTCVEPAVDERMILALVDRITELQLQVNKLCDIVAKLEAENEKLKKDATHVRKSVSEGLTQRVKDALTLDQWEELRRNE